MATKKLSFQIPSRDQIRNLVSTNKIAPGLNEATEKLKSFSGSAKESVSKLVNQDVSAIRTTISNQFSAIDSSAKDVFQKFESEGNNLQLKVREALFTLQSSPDNFLPSMEKIQQEFPDVDVQKILDKIQSGNFDVSVDVENITRIGDKYVKKAIPGLSSLRTPDIVELIPEVPQIEFPDLPDAIDIPKEKLTIGERGEQIYESLKERMTRIRGSIKNRIAKKLQTINSQS